MTRRSASKTTRENRRTSSVPVSRKHILDVRVRRSTARRQRTTRVLRVVLGTTLWIGVVVGLWFGFQAITNRFFLENPAYDLRQVDMQLDGLFTESEVLAMTGIERGQNIFRIDLGRAQRALREVDQVATVTIQRDWPDRLTIKVTKRIPVAWLARAGDGPFNSDRAWLLDAKGEMMTPHRIEPDYWRLPVIYCSNPDEIRNRDTLAMAGLKAALDLLAEHARRPDSPLDIRSIDITKGYALEVVDANKATITFAPGSPAAQLDRLEKLLENCQLTGRQLESANLIPKKYTPVRFLLASAQDPDAGETQPEAEH